MIYDISPKLGEAYKKNEIKEISFHTYDELSEINPYKIEILLNGEKLFYDYIKYRKLVIANMENLVLGKNEIDIYIYDSLNNQKNIKGTFFIIE